MRQIVRKTCDEFATFERKYYTQTRRRTRASAEPKAVLTRAEAALTFTVFARRTRGNRAKILVRGASNFFQRSAMISRVSSEIYAQNHRQTRAFRGFCRAKRGADSGKSSFDVQSFCAMIARGATAPKILVRRASKIFKDLRCYELISRVSGKSFAQNDRRTRAFAGPNAALTRENSADV